MGIESRGVDRRAMPPCSFDVKLSESAMTVKAKSAKAVTDVMNFMLEEFRAIECAGLVGVIWSMVDVVVLGSEAGAAREPSTGKLL